MPIVFVRIDDRLVHGQVVEGWIPYLKVDLIVVVSDIAAADGTQQALMQLGLPDGIQLQVLSTAQVGGWVSNIKMSDQRILILAPGPKEVLALIEAGLSLPSVNVGGMHYSAGRIQLGKVIFLTDEDRQFLKTIADKGIVLEGRAVPSDQRTNIVELL